MTKTTIEDALTILFRGQSNVKVMANDVGISLEEMEQLFRDYVAKTPIDPNVWKGDIEISWPYSGN
jgi:hypothetical protein